MKIMKRNTRTFYYLLYQGKTEIVDSHGQGIGEKKIVYSEPVQMKANVSSPIGQTHVEAFGDFVNYDKMIVTDDLSCPIDEYSVLFIDKEPEFDDDGNPLYDYVVKRVAKSLNSITIAATKVSVS